MSVIIVGGGMAGATLAMALSRLTGGALPVHLIEAAVPESQSHPGFDARAIALAAGTCRQLARVGVWQAIADCATAINRVQVSDRGHAGFVTLEAGDYQLAALGQVVELHEVGRRLFALLRDAPGVTLHCPQRVASVARRVDEVGVTLQNGLVLRGRLLVAADGSHSPLAELCGVQWRRQPYDQLAVIANVAVALPHAGRAFERFTRNGPLAMLPMSQGRCSLVWCQPPSLRDEVLSWPDERFCRELQSAFGWRLGRITHAGARSAYPLTLSVASRVIAHRLALVGNAAQTLHPIAGQGFNLGLRDVMTLAETLADGHARGEDCGGYPLLNQYQQRRAADKSATIGLTDGLAQLFASDLPPLAAARNLGLMAMELFPPARDALARRTLGLVAR